MADVTETDLLWMARALELAERGEGRVEPNPMVGCVIVNGGKVVGQGWHQKFGGPHAEVVALAAAGEAAAGSDLYVTLEPCCHQGKTPPCTKQIAAAGVRRVIAATQDPFGQVDGGGFTELRACGIDCQVGVLEAESVELLSPYLKLTRLQIPWVIAKWAMTLDGRIATATGDSQWISNAESREIVHQLRGRTDAVMIGLGTALRDDPLLTARPNNSADVLRTATRIVLDSTCALPCTSRLVQSAHEVPLLVVTTDRAESQNRDDLSFAGVEVFVCLGTTRTEQLQSLMLELGRRRMTNLMVEGGSELLSELFEMNAIDEVHAFIAPKLVGGADAKTPLGGTGIAIMKQADELKRVSVTTIGDNVYVRGRVAKQ